MYEQAREERDRRLSASGPYFWQRNLDQVEPPSPKGKGKEKETGDSAASEIVGPSSPSVPRKRKFSVTEDIREDLEMGAHWHIGRKKSGCMTRSRCLGVEPAEAINSREVRDRLQHPERKEAELQPSHS